MYVKKFSNEQMINDAKTNELITNELITNRRGEGGIRTLGTVSRTTV